MKRNIEADLIRWKNQIGRLPLILRGARQVGKTYIIEKFGKEMFENCVTLNFERNPEYKECFKSLDPMKIISAIELISGKEIQMEKTLLFLDEIQECPEAIMALRYFKEEMSKLHVIGAGSLLEFVLNDSKFGMPVGRVQFMYLRPLSFGEYLDASGNNKLRNFLKNFHINDHIEEVVHKKLLSLVREYFSIGGMPSIINEYLESKSLFQCQEKQTSILLTFRNDFGKYAKRTPQEYLQTIFTKAPGLIGKWLKYSTLDPEIAPKTLKIALKKLCEAGLIILVHATSAAGLPFAAHKNEKKAKFLFLDIGLVKRACNLDLELLFKEDLSLINDGALAEQFVGQELLACMGIDEMNELYAWQRQEKSSSAEIDFLISIGSKIVPIEVKAGSIGSLRSLKIFLNEKKSSLGLRISEAMFSINHQIASIPFYLIEEIPKLVKEIYGMPNFSIK
ncbi:MAG: ATP-binding protein [Parachlamydiales bacterium]|nr:ATP-binding protein [Parachlamydiales bacterium]